MAIGCCQQSSRLRAEHHLPHTCSRVASSLAMTFFSYSRGVKVG